ncbi:hypothetical protein F0726_02358 [Acidithiobacillus caldus]|nr:hypothetical protein F0726_02358 [Acidithiobacillus caldus]
MGGAFFLVVLGATMAGAAELPVCGWRGDQ